jgi:hypothetical protein
MVTPRILSLPGTVFHVSLARELNLRTKQVESADVAGVRPYYTKLGRYPSGSAITIHIAFIIASRNRAALGDQWLELYERRLHLALGIGPDLVENVLQRHEANDVGYLLGLAKRSMIRICSSVSAGLSHAR